MEPSNQRNLGTNMNPFLIPNVLDILFDHLPYAFHYKLRSVSQLWNVLLVNKIKRNHFYSVPLLKIIDLKSTVETFESQFRVGIQPGILDIGEVLEIVQAGRLKNSLLARVYFNESIRQSHSSKLFRNFLRLVQGSLTSIHYDGMLCDEFRNILSLCSTALENLTLWSMKNVPEIENRGLFRGKEKFEFPYLKSLNLASGDDGNCWFLNHLIRDGMCNYETSEIKFHYPSGRCNPPLEFLLEIIYSSPKLCSVSTRLLSSSFSKVFKMSKPMSQITSLRLKSIIGIRELRSLVYIGKQFHLKNLHLENVSLIQFYCFDNVSHSELDQFGHLLLEFLRSQAKFLQKLYLSFFLHYKTQVAQYETIVLDELFQNFPPMSNLTDLFIDEYYVQLTEIYNMKRLSMNTFGQIFPKLRRFGHVPYKNQVRDLLHRGTGMGHNFNSPSYVMLNGVRLYDIPSVLTPDPSACFTVESIHYILPLVDFGLVQIFPRVTELRLTTTLEIPRCLPYFWPGLKHLYYSVDLTKFESKDILKFLRIWTELLVGISIKECKYAEENYENDSPEEFRKIQFCRSRRSIMDLNYLETFDFHLSWDSLDSLFNNFSHKRSPLDIFISWGLNRMTHLKKMNFVLEYEEDANSVGLTDSFITLKRAFGIDSDFTEVHQEIHSREDFEYTSSSTIVKKQLKLEYNVDYHISSFDKWKYLAVEDPDINDLGLSENSHIIRKLRA